MTCVAVVASSAILSACDVTPAGPSDQPVQPGPGFNAFMFVHAEDVEVVISRHINPARFNITVRQQGKDVECTSHRDLLSISILRAEGVGGLEY